MSRASIIIPITLSKTAHSAQTPPWLRKGGTNARRANKVTRVTAAQKEEG